MNTLGANHFMKNCTSNYTLMYETRIQTKIYETKKTYGTNHIRLVMKCYVAHTPKKRSPKQQNPRLTYGIRKTSIRTKIYKKLIYGKLLYEQLLYEKLLQLGRRASGGRSCAQQPTPPPRPGARWPVGPAAWGDPWPGGLPGRRPGGRRRPGRRVVAVSDLRCLLVTRSGGVVIGSWRHSYSHTVLQSWLHLETYL